jgi:hypothetical protein
MTPLPTRSRSGASHSAMSLSAATDPAENGGEPSPHPGPTLLPPPRPRHSALALWHLLSLDAPTVAAVWTIFLARCSGITLPWVEPAAMCVAVWMIYAADRLLDARQLDARPLGARPLPNEQPPAGLEARHRFHHRHRRRFLALVVPTSLALVLLLHRIDPRALHLFTLLATFLGGWLMLIHARTSPAPDAHRLPKELAVGIFFPAATFIPTLARVPQLEIALLPPFLLFAAVCTLNCLFLYLWEHPQNRDHAHWSTRWATAHLIPIALATLTLATLATATSALHIFPLHHLPLAGIPALACALSVAFLLALHGLRHRIPAVPLRASADLALLTPLLLLPFLPK